MRFATFQVVCPCRTMMMCFGSSRCTSEKGFVAPPVVSDIPPVSKALWGAPDTSGSATAVLAAPFSALHPILADELLCLGCVRSAKLGRLL